MGTVPISIFHRCFAAGGTYACLLCARGRQLRELWRLGGPLTDCNIPGWKIH